MTRFILGARPSAEAALARSPAGGSTATLSGPALDAVLRRKRSAEYMAAVAKLDAGTHTHDPHATQALIDAIRQELPEISVEALPLGIVARCYLGIPFEVHTLDCVGNIVRHFKFGEALPGLMERARSLALHPEYAFVEVYGTRLIAVSKSGQTSLVEG